MTQPIPLEIQQTANQISVLNNDEFKITITYQGVVPADHLAQIALVISKQRKLPVGFIFNDNNRLIYVFPTDTIPEIMRRMVESWQ